MPPVLEGISSMKCEFCGADEPLPFVCNYCGGAFCADHRLPEAHKCKGDLSQKRAVVAPPTTTFTWSDSSFAPQPQLQPGRAFSAAEFKNIIVALVGLGVAFSIAFSGGFIGVDYLVAHPSYALLTFVVSIATVGSGFVLHELSHKFAARRYGYWAEFRVWPFGLLIAVATSLLGVVFAAPGATYISGATITRDQNGKISVVGPLVNIAVAAIFLPLVLYTEHSSVLYLVGWLGSYINIFLALFNLLPFMPLDGAKVFAWNRVYWGVLIAVLGVTFAAFLYYFPQP